MAGLGTKLWTSGEVVTAAGVNGYLQDQVIGTYASTSARDAAFGGAGEPTLAEGMFAYTSDTDTLWYYTGSVWQAVLGSNMGTISTSNRNVVINGGMSIWQRGTSSAGTTASYSAADRWLCFRSANAAGSTVYQISVGGVVAPTNYGLRVQRDSGNTSTANIAATSSFETINVTPLRGQILTLSFYARCGANYSQASSTLSATVFAGTGTDGNLAAGFTGTSTYASSTVTLTTSYQRFTVTGSAALGSTIGQLGVHFSYTPVGTAGANDWFEITGVQLEVGSVATPFEIEEIGTTLRKCQRYYYVLPRTSDVFSDMLNGGTVDNSGYARYAVYRPTMRSESFTLFSSAGTTFSNLNASGNQNGSTITFTNGMINLTSAGLSTGQATILRANNSATAYIALSTEL